MARIIPYKTHIRGRSRAFPGGIVGAFLIGVLAVLAVQYLSGGPTLTLPKIGPDAEVAAPPEVVETVTARVAFTLCGSGRRLDCVVDGDTFWLNGVKIRIADIDAPETHPPRCESEARLGEAATLRLAALLNAGPFTLRSGDRGEDRYGRKLRIVERGGQSLGAVLVSEGLARTWTGRREPWC